MKPKILKSEKDYEAALKLVDKLMDAKPGTSEEDDLELWSLLVEEYEERHYPLDPPDPIEAIKFRMDQMGLKQKDLTKYIPAKSKVSEVMNRKRSLSLPMIRALHKHLGIPADILVKEPIGGYIRKVRRGKTGTLRRVAKKPSTRVAAKKSAPRRTKKKSITRK